MIRFAKERGVKLKVADSHYLHVKCASKIHLELKDAKKRNVGHQSGDEFLRRLERATRAGDEDARFRWYRERLRRGERRVRSIRDQLAPEAFADHADFFLGTEDPPRGFPLTVVFDHDEAVLLDHVLAEWARTPEGGRTIDGLRHVGEPRGEEPLPPSHPWHRRRVTFEHPQALLDFLEGLLHVVDGDWGVPPEAGDEDEEGMGFGPMVPDVWREDGYSVETNSHTETVLESATTIAWESEDGEAWEWPIVVKDIKEDGTDEQKARLAEILEDVGQYVEGSEVYSIEKEGGWYAQLSLPGYMDTSHLMGPFETRFEAVTEIFEFNDVPLPWTTRAWVLLGTLLWEHAGYEWTGSAP